MTSSSNLEPEALRVWRLARNCAISPRQFFLCYCSLVIVSLSIAGVLFASGVWMVLPFACAELLVVGISFLFYARHAGDYDRIELSSARLLIERSNGAHVDQFEFNAPWTQIDLQDASSPKIEIRYAGQCIVVGSHIPVQRRVLIVDELRRSLREAIRCEVGENGERV